MYQVCCKTVTAHLCGFGREEFEGEHGLPRPFGLGQFVFDMHREGYLLVLEGAYFICISLESLQIISV